MRFGKYDLEREEISIVIIVAALCVVMFLFGVRFAYGKAITDANNQILEISKDMRITCEEDDYHPAQYQGVNLSAIAERLEVQNG